MHAILIAENHSRVWSEVPEPVRKDGEVIIDIHAAALNRADLLQREGSYPPPPGWPLGVEFPPSWRLPIVGGGAMVSA